jgi:hypothetical protein
LPLASRISRRSLFPKTGKNPVASPAGSTVTYGEQLEVEDWPLETLHQFFATRPKTCGSPAARARAAAAEARRSLPKPRRSRAEAEALILANQRD